MMLELRYHRQQYNMIDGSAQVQSIYKERRASYSNKFLTLFIMKRDFEIFEQSCEIWKSKERYSSRRIPRSLKFWSSGLPISLLLKKTLQTLSSTIFPFVRNKMNFAFDVLIAILFVRNQFDIFLQFSINIHNKILRFLCLTKHKPSSAKRVENRVVHTWKSFM